MLQMFVVYPKLIDIHETELELEFFYKELVPIQALQWRQHVFACNYY